MTGIETVAIIAVVAAAAVSAYGAYQAGEAQEDAAKYNAKVTKQRAAAQEDVYRDQVRRTMARNRALTQGVTPEGSPLMVAMDNAQQAELQAQRIRWGGEATATGLEFEGEQASKAGKIQAGATLLSGAGQAGGLYMRSSAVRPVAPSSSPGYIDSRDSLR